MVIKPIFTEEDDSEVVILRYLMSERCRSDPLNMTMVTFDVLTIDKRLSLAVMPRYRSFIAVSLLVLMRYRRWGSHFVTLDGFGTLGTALEFVHCMLKVRIFVLISVYLLTGDDQGLTFLHNNLIAHRVRLSPVSQWIYTILTTMLISGYTSR